jgi:hypothetical protein
MIELLIRLAPILLASAAAYLLASVQQQRKSKPTPRRPYRPTTSTRRSSASATYKPQSVAKSPRVRVPTNQELEKEKQLLSSLGGDRATAIRLLKYTYQNHPDRGYQWCLEKTISDLLRDRRS